LQNLEKILLSSGLSGMSFKIVALFILFGSSLGLGGIIISKIPALCSLPETIFEEDRGVALRIKTRVKKLNPLKRFSYDIFLQKVLTKIRILSLKTDTKTFNLLQKLRENNQRKKIKEDENYWDKIKKATKG